ncbi:MAG: type II secretion system protein GspN [Desulfatiglans sp.]|jgi:type II secretion system protein N|nr:type II secretion system protein GspN [Desulfatiglans sp.]
MKQPKKAKTRLFWYVLYGILLTLGSLYYLFPSEAVKDYIQTNVRERYPGRLLLLDQVRPSFPFGLRLTSAGISTDTDPNNIMFVADTIEVRPLLWPFLRGVPRYSYKGLAYGGTLGGHVDLTGEPAKTQLETSLSLEKIDVDQWSYISNLIGNKVNGTLGGTLSFIGQSNQLINGAGEANLKITAGSLGFPKPLMTLKSIKFDELWIKLSLKRRRIHLTRVELKGQEIQGVLSGTITLRSDIGKSRLNLKGTVEPFTSLVEEGGGSPKGAGLFGQFLKKGKFSFVIHGTIENPRMRFV